MQSSDLHHWHINATVYHDRIEEVHYISDPARKIRRKPHTQVWQVEKFLGRGGFGEVQLQINRENKKARAVKRIATTGLSNNECEKELQALLEFSKPKSREAAVFVDFFGWFKDGNDIYLAMEYVQLGDLENNIIANSGKVPESEARDITRQILSGLKIMHAESFAHRDLKPQNVLVINGPPNWWVKLADFGLSKRLTDTTAFYTRAGTQSYMAPELLNYLSLSVEYTNAIDLWSTGCIAYRLVAGVVPFPPGLSLIKYCEDRSQFPNDPLFDCGIKSSGAKFLQRLLLPYPKDRPTASEALRSDWILAGTTTGQSSSEIIQQPAQEDSGFSELDTSQIDFNSNSHIGLKSFTSSTKESFMPSLEVSNVSSSHATNFNAQDSEQTIKPPANNLPEKLKGRLGLDALKPNPLGKLTRPAVNLSHIMTRQRTLDAKPLPERQKGKGTQAYLKLPAILKGHYTGVRVVAFSPDGKQIASASNDNTVRLWNSKTGAAGAIFEGNLVAFSPNDKQIVTVSEDNTVRLWDLATGAAGIVFKSHSEPVNAIAFSPDGKKIATASYDKTMRLWDSATGTAGIIFKGHSNLVCAIAFSPNGKQIASASYDKTIRLWDSSTEAISVIFRGHSQAVSAIAFSPDGKRIASASYDKTVRLWDLATRTTGIIYKGHTNWVCAVIFSPDGKQIASASDDKTIRLWDSATGETDAILKGHSNWIRAIAYSPDGKQIASGSDDNTVRLWDSAMKSNSKDENKVVKYLKRAFN